MEMHTTATENFQSALSTYAGVTGDPSFSEYYGYLSVDALVQGLKVVEPTRPSRRSSTPCSR